MIQIKKTRSWEPTPSTNSSLLLTDSLTYPHQLFQKPIPLLILAYCLTHTNQLPHLSLPLQQRSWYGYIVL